jgi:metal-responsive CopG/Arc/MetJ family transcriptional regulator
MVKKISSVELSASADKTRKRKQRAFSSISLPTALLERIEDVVNELRYWPTKTAFVREASLEKLSKYREEKLDKRK